jgi:hypothetical protein
MRSWVDFINGLQYHHEGNPIRFDNDMIAEAGAELDHLAGVQAEAEQVLKYA